MIESSPAPFLKFKKGDGREIPLIAGNVWKIGRGEENAVVLIDNMVSRNHAMIQQLQDGEFYLIDMGSCNGSFLNGVRLTAPAVLRDGDLLSFENRVSASATRHRPPLGALPSIVDSSRPRCQCWWLIFVDVARWPKRSIPGR